MRVRNATPSAPSAHFLASFSFIPLVRVAEKVLPQDQLREFRVRHLRPGRGSSCSFVIAHLVAVVAACRKPGVEATVRVDVISGYRHTLAGGGWRDVGGWRSMSRWQMAGRVCSEWDQPVGLKGRWRVPRLLVRGRSEVQLQTVALWAPPLSRVSLLKIWRLRSDVPLKSFARKSLAPRGAACPPRAAPDPFFWGAFICQCDLFGARAKLE